MKEGYEKKGGRVMRKNILRLFSMLLTSVFAFSVFPVMADGDLSEWAAAEVEEAVELGIVAENLQKDYSKNITREEFAVTAMMFVAYQNNMDFGDMQYLYINGDSLSKVSADEITLFDDLAETEYANYIMTAAAMGIVKGKGNNLFDPFSPITREEAAVMLSRVCTMYASDKPAPESEVADMADSDSISDWARDSVKKVCALNIMQGMPDGTFAPKNPYTREQCYATFVRLCKKSGIKSRFHGDNLCFWSYDELLGNVKGQPNYESIYSCENDFCSVEVGFASAFFSGRSGFWIVYKNGGRKDIMRQFGKISPYKFNKESFKFSDDGKILYCSWSNMTDGIEETREYVIDLEKASIAKS